MAPNNKLMRYIEEFLNKPIEFEYYVNRSAEFELEVNFLKPLLNYKLLKFIGLDKKFNPDHVRAFYYNLKVSSNELGCDFHYKVIKFTLDDFRNRFELVSKGNDVCISN